MHGRNPQINRQLSHITTSCDEYTDDELDLEEDVEETCAIHSKELDMVCLESTCQTPVCSKCILIGDHKNHEYVEIEKFFNVLEKEKKEMVSYQKRIETSEQQLKMNNNNVLITNQIKNQLDQVESGIEMHCENLIREIRSKKEDAMREATIFFEQLGEKLQNYVLETVNVVKYNKDWKRKVEDALKLVNQNESDIESGFLFKEESQVLQVKENGERIIVNIADLQTLINKKMIECQESFNLGCNSLNQNLLVITKNEVSFKQDLRERMQIFYGEKAKKIPKNQLAFNQNFDQVEDFNNDDNEQDPDLFGDPFDPECSDLMAGLKKVDLFGKRNSKTGGRNIKMNQNDDSNNINMSMVNGPNNNLNRFQNQMRESHFAREEEMNFYSQSNMNNYVPMEAPDLGRRRGSGNKTMLLKTISQQHLGKQSGIINTLY